MDLGKSNHYRAVYAMEDNAGGLHLACMGHDDMCVAFFSGFETFGRHGSTMQEEMRGAWIDGTADWDNGAEDPGAAFAEYAICPVVGSIDPYGNVLIYPHAMGMAARLWSRQPDDTDI